MRARRAQLTVRGVVLAAALVIVALTLALPFKTWLSQREQISTLEASNAAAEKHVTELQRERQEWQNPAYIERQARLRLHYVMPGQTEYVVLGRGHKHRVTPQHHSTDEAPWYSQLWTSTSGA